MASDQASPRAGTGVAARLAWFFVRNGYVRRQDPKRLGKEGPSGYKKGFEVRLTAQSSEELELIRDLLHRAGFKPGRPFRKDAQYRQPIYGRESVMRFLELIGEPPLA